MDDFLVSRLFDIELLNTGEDHAGMASSGLSEMIFH
jgi:hypothetical protein